MIGQLIALLFFSRDIAHREHFKTHSYSQHMALNTFYLEVIELADDLAEMYQGRHGIIEDIPLLESTEHGTPADMLQQHKDTIESIRYEAVSKTDTPIQNKIDEIVGLYLSTLYKLRNLK